MGVEVGAGSLSSSEELGSLSTPVVHNPSEDASECPLKTADEGQGSTQPHKSVLLGSLPLF